MTGQAEAKSALTDFLNQIGDEEVTICIDGVPKQVTRAEALARKMYLLALGGTEEVMTPEGVQKIYHKPDYRVAKIIREYTEGKPAPEAQPERGKGKKAGAFHSKIGARLNEQLNPDPSKVSRPRIPVKKKEGEK